MGRLLSEHPTGVRAARVGGRLKLDFFILGAPGPGHCFDLPAGARHTRWLKAARPTVALYGAKAPRHTTAYCITPDLIVRRRKSARLYGGGRAEGDARGARTYTVHAYVS